MENWFILLNAEDIVSVSELEAIQKVLGKMSLRFIINLFSAFFLAKLIYQRFNKNTELLFTFLMFNLCIFFICFLLNKVDLSMGAAFGLFAVFGMLRYRTEDVTIKDMTYIFLFIALGLLNAIAKIKGAGYAYEGFFLLIINALTLCFAALLESKWLFKKESVRTITYGNIDLVNKNNTLELIADLKEITGLPITRIKITKVDLIDKEAQIKIYYSI